MSLFKRTIPETIRIITKVFFWSRDTVEIQKIENFLSEKLSREVRFDVFLPPAYFENKAESYPILLFNDGQDMEAIKLAKTLDQLYKKKELKKIIVVGIHAGDRTHEYGTAGKLDYQNRGNKALEYTHFIIEELLPFLHVRYRCSLHSADYTFAGFSLGALSAFDIVWNHPEIFKNIGVFSGSLWWRSQPYTPENPDGHRILHQMVASSEKKEGLKFWFQAGTNDELEDRNNNDIIDAIDDTLHLMNELENKGYARNNDFTYLQVEGGEHNPQTWARVLPDFLKWVYGK